MDNFELVKYALTQGGLVLVCLVVFHFYRRDFLSKVQSEKDDKAILIDIVQQNTRAYGRLTTAIDRRQRVADDDG